VKVHSKEMVLPFKPPLDQRINDEQKLSYASFLPLKK